MSDNSRIEWCSASWTPIRARGALGKWFCQRISPGCENCYASTFNRRMGGQPYAEVNPEVARALVASGEIYLDQDALRKPLNWRKPRRVFLSSMTDVFGEWVPDEWLDEIWAMMALTPQHTFQVLSKRPSRMRDYLNAPATPERIEHYVRLLAQVRGLPCADELEQWPLPNVWLGVSVESDAYAWRAKVLSEIPAAVRFVSAEPLLGPLPSLAFSCPLGLGCEAIDGHPCICRRGRSIDWLIVGGESGGPAERRLVKRCGNCGGGAPSSSCHYCHGQPWQPKPEALEWVRDLRDRATAAGVAFMFKQLGGPTHSSGGRLLDGRTWDEMPRMEARSCGR